METFKLPKPHKGGNIAGIPVVIKQVSKEVRQVLELMEQNPDSHIERKRLLNFGRLIIPGQPMMKIEQGFLLPIIEYCKIETTLWDSNPPIDVYKLHPEAMKTIRFYEQK